MNREIFTMPSAQDVPLDPLDSEDIESSVNEDVRKRGNKWCAYVDDKLTKAEKEANPKRHKGKKVGSVQRTPSGKIRMKARACYPSKKKANNAMAAAMMESPAVSAVRSMVREIVLEDSKSFQDRTFGITYDENDISTTPARDLKRAWAAEADHDFFRKLIKVHWIKGLPGRMGNVSSFLPALLEASRKDEISVMGYVDKPKKTPWGEFGVMVQGRTTLAADNMNHIVSDYREDLDPEYIEKYSRTSGVPRRASMFDALTAKHYILDAESYGNKGEWGNELIVDNWEPVGIIAPTWFMQQVKEPWYAEAYREGGKGPEVIVMRTIIESGLPVYRTDGKPYNMGSIINSLGLS